MTTGDIFSLAYRTVRSNKLRTGLTVAIIAFGIMALVGIITAIKAMNQKFMESFSTMGANGFTIRFKERQIHFGGGGQSDLKVAKKGKRKERRIARRSSGVRPGRAATTSAEGVFSTACLRRNQEAREMRRLEKMSASAMS